MARGVFIAVEGPDGAGKTTLVAALNRRLLDAGRSVTGVREPGGTLGAEAARALVLNHEIAWTAEAELFLMLAARAELVREVIQPALKIGHVVLTDRYELSTFAYQVAGRRLPRPLVAKANRLATGGLSPDLTIVLDVPPALGRDRQRARGKPADRMEREGVAWHTRVARAFLTARGKGFVHVNASGDAADVAETAWGHVRKRLRIRA